MEQLSAKAVGLLIKSHRKQAGLTQFELAEKIGIDEKQVGKIERGIHYPSVPTFLKLIKLFEININEFYRDEMHSVSTQESKLLRLIHGFSPKEQDLTEKILDVVMFAMR